MGPFPARCSEVPEDDRLVRGLGDTALRVGTLRDRLLSAEVSHVARDVLADPADLLAHVDTTELVDDDGQPDRDKIATAAAALAEQKPHLKSCKVAGDVGQGARGGTTPDAFDFSQVLRQAASG